MSDTPEFEGNSFAPEDFEDMKHVEVLPAMGAYPSQPRFIRFWHTMQRMWEQAQAAWSGATAAVTIATQWATKTDGPVEPGKYSAQEHAVGTQTRGQPGGGSSKDWSSYMDGTVDDAEYSAKYRSAQAASAASAAAASALASENAAAAAAAAAASGMYQRVETLTAADSPYLVPLSDEGVLLRCDTTDGDVEVVLDELDEYGEDMKVAAVKVAGDNKVLLTPSGGDTINASTNSVEVVTLFETHAVVGDYESSAWIDVIQVTGIPTGAVTTPKLADAAVTNAKLAAAAVDNTKIANDAVTSEKLAPGLIVRGGVQVNNDGGNFNIRLGWLDGSEGGQIEFLGDGGDYNGTLNIDRFLNQLRLWANVDGNVDLIIRNWHGSGDKLMNVDIHKGALISNGKILFNVDGDPTFPALTPYNPVLTGSTGGTITPIAVTGKYAVLGKMCYVSVDMDIGSVSGVTGDLRVTLPLTAGEAGASIAGHIRSGAIHVSLNAEVRAGASYMTCFGGPDGSSIVLSNRRNVFSGWYMLP